MTSTSTSAAEPVESFIARWQDVAASELATAQSFVIDLCALLGVPAPHATAEQDYMFERRVSFRHGDGSASPGRIDCYKRGHFVLEAKKVRVGAGDTALNAKEKTIHEKGLVAVLKTLHEELDAAVLDAYGWRDQPSDETLLERLVALNTQRRAEEAQGQIRWLRPEFQAPQSTQAAQAPIGLESGGSGRRNQKPDAATSPPAPARTPTQQTWPPTLPEQLAVVAKLLADSPTAQTEAQLAANFTGKGRWKSRLPDIIKALEALARARRLDDDRWMG